MKRLFIIAVILLACAQAGSAQILPPDTTRLTLHSEPGDPWSDTFHKSDWLYQPPAAQFVYFGLGPNNDILTGVRFVVRTPTELWLLDFTAGRAMTPGTYDSEATDLAMYGQLDISGLGRGCLTQTGKFTVLDIDYFYKPLFGFVVTRFAATFEHHCYGLPAALRGTIYFNSNGIPPPPKMVMKDRPPMPDATVGAAYSQLIEAEGGTPPYQWTVFNGELPPGLFLDTNGRITGAPTTTGMYKFTVELSDSASIVNGYPSQILFRDFSITVNQAPFSISDGLPPAATKDSGYTYQFAAFGGMPPYQWSRMDGTLPSGLTLSGDGKLSGIPSSPGLFSFRLRASDNAGHELSRAYAIKVIDPPRITTAAYKLKKAKLVITGEKFDPMAVLQIDGHEVTPKSHDSESFVVKALSLERGAHELRVVNPDGGAAAVMITVE